MEQKEQNRRLVRSTLAVSTPTILSRIFGYIRDMIQAKYLGTGRSADAYYMAYNIPNLLRRLTGEGAMTAAFVPVFTQMKKEKSREELWKFANAFFFDLTVIMAVITVLGIVFAFILVRIIAPGFDDIPGKWDLTTALTRIMFPYIFLISLAALAMAILNSFHKFFVPAFTPVLFNLAIITVALLFARNAEEPAFIFAVGVVLGGALQLGFQLPFLWQKGMRFKFGLSFKHPAVRKVAKLMIPGVFSAGIIQINFFISRMLASLLEEESVSSLYFASRVQEITLGIFSIALSIALLPTFSEQAARKDIQGMKKTLIFSLKLVFFITLPAMVGLLVLSRPIIQVLFERGMFDAQSTSMSALCLFYFAFSLPFISGVRILAPAFYSLKDTKTPAVVAFFVMIIYISCSLILMGPLRVGGIALALSFSVAFNFFVLFAILERKIGKVEKKEFIASAFKSAFSAAVMGGLVWFFMKQFDFPQLIFLKQLGVLFAAIALGILAYILFNLLFNHEDLRSLRDIFSRERILRR
ncbi:MAG: murein biosynthesis integral membrane protein MurJ [Candidatus Aminicenantes bacterium]|nr:MAG: murein biosynthesis integral membrane protein MurJ [Candidatus Aminicenantes bacterium]